LGLLVLLVFNGDSPQASLICLMLCILAQASDHLDGWLARKFSVPTLKGYIQDSLSDKLLMISVLLAICREFNLGYFVIYAVVFRELSLYARRLSEDEKKTGNFAKANSIIFSFALRPFLFFAICRPYLMEQGMALDIYAIVPVISYAYIVSIISLLIGLVDARIVFR